MMKEENDENNSESDDGTQLIKNKEKNEITNMKTVQAEWDQLMIFV